MSSEQMARVASVYAAAKNSYVRGPEEGKPEGLRLDIEAALSCCTEDYIYESVALPMRIEGKEQARLFYASFFSAVPDYEGVFDASASGEDAMAFWGRFTGTVRGELFGIAPTGRRLDVPVCFVVTFREGLIARDVGYFDLATLCEHAGYSVDQVRASLATFGAASA